MVKQEDFLVERWMDEYETKVSTNIAETCCASLSLKQVSEIIGKPIPFDQLANMPLTYGIIPGSLASRKAISAIYNETGSAVANNSTTTTPQVPIITPDDVLVSNGAIGANFLLYYSLVGPGDHVVVIDPIYQQLQSVPKMFGADISLLKLTSKAEYQPDLNEFKSLLKPSTKLVIINSPHNPSGVVWSTETLQKIIGLVKDHAKTHKVPAPYIHCDEVYRPVFFEKDESKWPLSIVHLYEKGISTSSATKAYGLAGLRFGWLVSRDSSVLVECTKRRDYSTISVSMVDDLLASWALESRGWHKLLSYHLATVCIPNLKVLKEWVAASNGAVSYVVPQGGTTILLHIVGVPNGDTVAFAKEFVTKKKVLVVPGETFNSPGTIRIGFANDSKAWAVGLGIIQDFLIEKKYVPAPWGHK